MSAQVVTVEQLKARGEAALLDSAASTSASKTAAVTLGGEELPWHFLAGKLVGNIDSGDLELRDRTGAVPVSVDVSGTDDGSWQTPSGSDVTIRVDTQFTLLVEAVDAVGVAGATPAIVFAVRASLSSIMSVESVDSEDEDTSSAHGSGHASKHESELKVIFLMVTHIASVTQATTRWGGAARPQYRHIHGVVFRASRDVSGAGFVEKAHCAELLVGGDCASAWHVKKHGLYRVRATRIRSESDRSGGFNMLAPADDHAVRALQEAWKHHRASNNDQADSAVEPDRSCVLPVVAEVERVLGAISAEQGARRKLRVYRVDKRGSFVSTVFQPAIASGAPGHSESSCREHEACRQAYQGAGPHCELDLNSLRPRCSAKTLVLRSCMPIAKAVQPIPVQALRYFTALTTVMRRRDVQSWRQVSTFLVHGTVDAVSTHAPETNVHQPRLMALIGVVCERRYYWRDNSQYVDAGAKLDASAVGEKRRHEEMSSSALGISSDQSRRLMCVIRVRDLSSLDTVDVHIDTTKFGFRAGLQPGDVVEFSKLQGFVARSTYRAYLNWSYLTSARVLWLADPCLPSEAGLYGSLPTSFLNDLYSVGSSSNGAFDRRLHRYVVRVVYVNYVILKRKCRSCHRALVHDRRRGWMHFTSSSGNPSSSQPSRRCGWYQLQHTDAALARHSYVHTNMRCIIDDGSAQAELFLENEVAWELLRCSPAQRCRLTDVRVSELRFFAGQTPTAGGFFSSAGVNDDELYYENQLREVVLSAVAQLRQLAVFARRFYSKASEANNDAQGRGGAANGAGPTSILTFGRDVQVVTRTTAPAKLDARRVDDVHVKSELRQLLARLRV